MTVELKRFDPVNAYLTAANLAAAAQQLGAPPDTLVCCVTDACHAATLCQGGPKYRKVRVMPMPGGLWLPGAWMLIAGDLAVWSSGRREKAFAAA